MVIPKSKFVEEEQKMNFKYNLLETQTGFGPSYKLDVTFANGFKTMMSIGEWDGKNSINIGYIDFNKTDTGIMYINFKCKKD